MSKRSRRAAAATAAADVLQPRGGVGGAGRVGTGIAPVSAVTQLGTVSAIVLGRPLFIVAIGLSAFLLFTLELLSGRVVLPVFGGTPAVWTTALCFFTAVVFVGYLYAHALVTRLGQRRGGLVHLVVAVAALIATVAAPTDLGALRRRAPARILTVGTGAAIVALLVIGSTHALIRERTSFGVIEVRQRTTASRAPLPGRSVWARWVCRSSPVRRASTRRRRDPRVGSRSGGLGTSSDSRHLAGPNRSPAAS